MKDISYEIRRYEEQDADAWDAFLLRTVNGTFLQSRKFLSYHPAGRFEDCSLMIYDAKGNLAGLCPGAVQVQEGHRVFVSHPGSTFGGLLVDAKYYRAVRLIEMMKQIEKWLIAKHFQAIDLRITSSIFSREPADLLEYVLVFLRYREAVELSTYIDYKDYREPVEANFSQGKRTHVHKSQKQGLYGRPLKNLEELNSFYKILCGNLQKYNARPVHTMDELQDFAEKRLQRECGFFGIFLPQGHREQLIAGGMLFYFLHVNAAHTQYLAASSEYRKYNPATYLYYYIINVVREQGFEKLSFGISTERRGEYLNERLIESKEDYGSKHSVNRKFWKNLDGCGEIQR